jgi:hypothetical protein
MLEENASIGDTENSYIPIIREKQFSCSCSAHSRLFNECFVLHRLSRSSIQSNLSDCQWTERGYLFVF